jgi:predicted nucleic-acid-binding Zn-ribbon protein
MAQPMNETTCIKCGGKMIQGRINIPVDRITTQTMPRLASGFEMRGVPGIEDFHATPKWEEKTGNKTGFIFKRDEVREMGLKGYRCSNCNYVELYARP